MNYTNNRNNIYKTQDLESQSPLLLIIVVIVIVGLLLYIFSDKEYKVTYKYYDDNQKVIETTNQMVTEPAVPKRDGYTFIGWYVGDEKFDFNTTITGDIILIAKWQKNDSGDPNSTPTPQFPDNDKLKTVTFDSNGGTKVLAILVNKGDTISEPETPIKEGYIFKGWYTSSNTLFDFKTKIVDNLTLYANWEEDPQASKESSNEDNKYIVTFNSNGGSTVKAINVARGKTITKPNNPSRSGYTFIGWYTAYDTLFDFNIPINNNMTLYAKWQKKETSTSTPTKQYVTVTFDSAGGSSVGAIKIEKGNTVAKPSNPTRSGYTFTGWYTSSNAVFDFKTKINSNMTLYAHWQKNATPAKQYVTVTFNTDGGSSVASKTIEKGSTVSKPSNPTKSGYTFLGWYTSSNTSFNFSTSITSNITLYAHWQKNATTPAKEYVTVTFNTNGGNSLTSKRIEKGSTVSKPSNPTKSGYQFVGWYTSSKTDFNFSTKVNSSMTLYALWAPKISYTKSTTGKFIFINNPESLVSESYLADTGHTSLYTDSINGNVEIFYSHNVYGNLNGKIYYAFRVYNPSTTKTVTLTINKCGITSSWDELTVWDQYYNNKCPAQKTITIPPGKFKYIFHNNDKFTIGDADVIGSVKKPTGVFHGVLNVTSNGELLMATIAFKDVTQSYNNPYAGNFEGEVQTYFSKTLDERYTSGYHKGLPVVTNNMTVEIYDQTPKGNLKVSYVNPAGTTKVDSKWATNTVGGMLNGTTPQINVDQQTSDMLEFIVPKRNNKTVIYGPYPQYKETGTNVHPIKKVSIKGWPYSLANWGVHYNENITIKNNSSTNKSVSFIISDFEQVAIYYQNRVIKCDETKEPQSCSTVWTVTVKPHQSLKVPAVLTLATNTNGYVGKKLVLNN